jgi:hypothetical protein
LHGTPRDSVISFFAPTPFVNHGRFLLRAFSFPKEKRKVSFAEAFHFPKKAEEKQKKKAVGEMTAFVFLYLVQN